MRRRVWSRNIKNGCSIYIYIYIYNISRLRVNMVCRNIWCLNITTEGVYKISIWHCINIVIWILSVWPCVQYTQTISFTKIQPVEWFSLNINKFKIQNCTLQYILVHNTHILWFYIAPGPDRIRGSLSNFTHFHPPVIQYHIVHLFNDFWCCCTFWTSFTWITFKAGTATFKLGSPFLNPLTPN